MKKAFRNLKRFHFLLFLFPFIYLIQKKNENGARMILFCYLLLFFIFSIFNEIQNRRNMNKK